MSGRQVQARYNYLRASSVLDLGRLGPYDEMVLNNGAAFLAAGQAPSLVIFISHRWQTRVDPDPAGSQLRAIQYVLRHIPKIASLLHVSSEERRHCLPSLRHHGVVQAAILVSAADRTASDTNVWKEWAHAIESVAPEQLLDQIGVWYDYSCMPSIDVQVTRGAAESLIDLPELVRSAVTLILREPNDDYAERGWCAAELAASRQAEQHIVVRMDLLGSKFTDDDLSAHGASQANSGSEMFDSAGLFRMALDAWESRDKQTPNLWGLYIGLPDIKPQEEARSVPFFTTGRHPNAFPQQRALLVHFMDVLKELSAIDARRGSLVPSVDFADLARRAMRNVGLKCSEPWDEVFVCLSILRSRHAGGLVPTIENFYQTALTRWVRGESLQLVRYREKRRTMTWTARFRFEGERRYRYFIRAP